MGAFILKLVFRTLQELSYFLQGVNVLFEAAKGLSQQFGQLGQRYPKTCIGHHGALSLAVTLRHCKADAWQLASQIGPGVDGADTSVDKVLPRHAASAHVLKVFMCLIDTLIANFLTKVQNFFMLCKFSLRNFGNFWLKPTQVKCLNNR